MYQFLLPDAGEGTHESEIIRWLVKPGDEVHEDQILLEMQSDKAIVELPSPVAGTVARCYVPEGKMAIVGEPIVDIETGDGDTKPGKDAPEAKAAGAPAEQASAPKPQPKAEPEPAEAAGSGQPDATAPQAAAADVRSLAVPRVRRYAREKGVDLTQVTGTGNRGLITIDDVDAHLAAGGQADASPSTAPSGGGREQDQDSRQEQGSQQERQLAAAEADGAQPEGAQPAGQAGDGTRREPMSQLRKRIAKALVRSRVEAPHVTVLDKAEVSALVAHRAKLKPIAAERGISLTYTPYVVKACVAMLKRHPDLNASVDMEREEMIIRSDYNIGVATNTDNGLLVPILKHADRLSLFQIAAAITETTEKAKAGKLSRADMSDGSLSITNVGGAATGGVWSTPIINTPESAIIGIGRIEEEFLPDENRQPVLKPVMKISFAFDHRVVDGVYAQGALNDLKRFLSDPDLLLAEA